MTAQRKRKPQFASGDRVKMWGKSTDKGTVDEAWINDENSEIVAVVWDSSGCVGEARGYQLQYVSG